MTRMYRLQQRLSSYHRCIAHACSLRSFTTSSLAGIVLPSSSSGGGTSVLSGIKPVAKVTPGAANGEKPKVIVLAGATGVGKTRLSLALAQHLNGEIINADSVQQYQGMDIGSNKLPLDQRQGVPHHCFDLSPISRPITVTDYSHHAHSAIDDIVARGKTPILVGGSGFYLRWFFHPPEQPQIPPEISELVQQLLDDGQTPDDSRMIKMSKLAYRIDELPTEQFEHKKKNLIYEVLRNPRVAGSRRYATYYLEQVLTFAKLPTTYVPPTIDTIRALPFDYRCYYLSCDREWLNRWIDLRCEQLIQNGMLQEVKRLEIKENLSQYATVAAAIGYRQALKYLSVLTSTASSVSHDTDSTIFEKELIETFPQFLATMQSATRNYVRKQDVWFRKDPFYQFLRIPTPALPSFPVKSIQRLQDTQVDLHAWLAVEQQVIEQMQWTEKEYWNHPMWKANSTVAAGAENPDVDTQGMDSGDKPDYDSGSTDANSSGDDTATTNPPIAPTIESLSAYKSLSFTPSSTLSQSLQSALRLQTNLGSRAEQRRRREYRTQNFIYDEKANKPAIQKLVQEVIQYNPLKEK